MLLYAYTPLCTENIYENKGNNANLWNKFEIKESVFRH